jgi:hypothetical protein
MVPRSPLDPGQLGGDAKSKLRQRFAGLSRRNKPAATLTTQIGLAGGAARFAMIQPGALTLSAAEAAGRAVTKYSLH